MEVIESQGVSEAFYLGLQLLKEGGIKRKSRAGDVVEYPEPVCTVYRAPEQRVLFYEERDANPFFHFFEAFWMIAGRQDVEYVSKFNKRMKEYSDDGVIFHGAYGYRWRNYFGYDQHDRIVKRLGNIQGDRRAVLSMWDARMDLKKYDQDNCKDLPCNTHIYFKVKPCDDRYEGKDIKNPAQLDMTVCCRSNDIIWGTYGTNAVHFSMLQEYLAARLNAQLGVYRHISDSFHAYSSVLEKVKDIQPDFKPYELWDYEVKPLVDDPESFKNELFRFLEDPHTKMGGARNSIFPTVAYPMITAWEAYRNVKDLEYAINVAATIEAKDWQIACVEWLKRRKENINHDK